MLYTVTYVHIVYAYMGRPPRGLGGGRPPRGLGAPVGGAPALLWATGAAAAVGPGGTGGSPNRQYKAPTDYTKPQKDYTKI